MPENASEGLSPIVPYLYYEDAGAAIDFMEKAFGFEIESVVRNGDDGQVIHAQVRAGNSVLFVGPGMDAFGTRAVPDSERVSAMIYVFVHDVAAHYLRAKGAGARIREELHEHFGGNRQYTASDLGGHRWSFAQPIAE